MLYKFDCIKKSREKKPCRFLDVCFHYFFDNDYVNKAIQSVIKSADLHEELEDGQKTMKKHDKFLVVLLGLSAMLHADLVYMANDVHTGEEAAANARSPFPCMVLFHERKEIESYNKIAVLYFIGLMDFNFHAVDLT